MRRPLLTTFVETTLVVTTLGAAALAVAAVTPAAASAGPPPFTFEGQLYGGWADASTFGWNVNSSIFGGGGALRLPFNQFRLQTDLRFETADFSSSVGNPTFVAGATHLDWMH